MKQIRNILFTVFVTLTCNSFAQVQEGIVKTNGRPNRPGTPLSGVVVKVSGHSASISSDKGEFGIEMNGYKGGDGYFLTSVKRSGYELADRNAIGREYSFSSTVPLVLSMVSQEEIQAEKKRICDNATIAAQKEYDEKLAQLEKELEDAKISREAFSKQLQELQDKQDKFRLLAEDLADKYARTDYDFIKGVDKEINEAIEVGDFNKADSLLKSKGDISKRHQKILEWKEANKAERARLEHSDSLLLMDLENLAADYYHSFTIASSKMQFDEAALYLEKRLELDPDRFDWLIDAGTYYKVNLAQYDKAMKLYEQALRIAKHTKSTKQLSLVYEKMASVHLVRYEAKKAIKYYMDILSISKKENDTAAIVSVYNNLGSAENILGHLDESLHYFEKALKYATDSMRYELTDINYNISTNYAQRGDIDKAVEYMDKSLEIANSTGNKLQLASIITYKCSLLHEKAKYREAIDLGKKALELREQVLTKNHPDIANTMRNIAASYYSLSQLSEVLDYNIKSLDICQAVYGDNHPDIAFSYKNIAQAFLDAGKYDTSLKYLKKAEDIYKFFFPAESEKFASLYNMYGMLYSGLDQDSISLAHYKEAMTIYEKLGMTNKGIYATVCVNTASLLCKIGRFEEALSYQNKSLAISENLGGKHSNIYIAGLNTLAHIYGDQGQLDTALEIYMQADTLVIEEYGKYHERSMYNYTGIGQMYLDHGEYEKARTYMLQALEVCDSIYKEPTENKMLITSDIGLTYFHSEQYKDAYKWLRRAADMCSTLYGNSYRAEAYYTYAFSCLVRLIEEGKEDDIQKYKEIMDSTVCKVIIQEGSLCESLYKLSGEYFIFAYGDWNLESQEFATNAFTRLRETENKDLVLFRDGIVNTYHFDAKQIGIQLIITPYDKELKSEILSEYSKWKELQN